MFFSDVCFVLLQENECLKKEVFEKSSRIEEQNRKIGDLINQNQKWAVENITPIFKVDSVFFHLTMHHTKPYLETRDLQWVQVHVIQEQRAASGRLALGCLQEAYGH